MSDINNSKLMGGKIKNGHKMNCKCHICENMKSKARRNGYEEDVERALDKKSGTQKINGHKKNCNCPICKNMKNAKDGKNKSMKIKKSNGHKKNCNCPICKNMKKKGGSGDDDEEKTADIASDDDYEEMNRTKPSSLSGGKKYKTKKSNGHKKNCRCPICKNMRKTKKNKKQ